MATGAERTLLGRGTLALAFAAALAGCGGAQRSDTPPPAPAEVVVYVSTDRVFAEPVLQEYERRARVSVRAVYDMEETKSTGLANRLVAERDRPRADVFWSNEPMRTLVLKSRGVLAPYRSPSAEGIPAAFLDPDGYWSGFSARLRVIVYNTDLVKPAEAPKSVFELADPRWRGQVAIADPRFGTTAFHVAALYTLVGDERADALFDQLDANGVKIVAGNSVVRDLAARGQIKVGLTDTDDVNVALEDGQPVAMIVPDADQLGAPVMPNMVSLIANGPNPEAGRRLIDYLLSAEVEQMLARSQAVQIPLHTGVPPPKNMPAISSIRPMLLDYGKAAARVEDVTARLQRILRL